MVYLRASIFWFRDPQQRAGQVFGTVGWYEAQPCVDVGRRAFGRPVVASRSGVGTCTGSPDLEEGWTTPDCGGAHALADPAHCILLLCESRSGVRVVQDGD